MPYPRALLAPLSPLSFATTLGGRESFTHFTNENTKALLASNDLNLALFSILLTLSFYFEHGLILKCTD